MKDLSIIILSYNTQEITLQCLQSVFDSVRESQITCEIIVVDNASSDDSVQQVKKFSQSHSTSHIHWNILANTKNTGFAKGNNQGLNAAKGRYILFLNSDIIINDVDFKQVLSYMDDRSDLGVLSVRVILPNKNIDPASHRGFPTLWNSFCYFMKLEKLFGTVPLLNKFIGGYHLTYHNLNTVHEIDSPTGAFFLVKKSVLDKSGGFDEDYFMYGEDIDLAYRIKKSGYKILYFPRFQVTHLKYRSGLQKPDPVVQQKTKDYFYNAMKIFFRKHYAHKYLQLVNSVVYRLIDIKKQLS